MYYALEILMTIKTTPRQPSQHETSQRLKRLGAKSDRARIYPLSPSIEPCMICLPGKIIGVRRCNAIDQWMITSFTYYTVCLYAPAMRNGRRQCRFRVWSTHMEYSITRKSTRYPFRRAGEHLARLHFSLHAQGPDVSHDQMKSKLDLD